MNPTSTDKPTLKIKGAIELSPAPESYSVTINERYGHYIGGKHVAGDSGTEFTTINPATGDKLASLATAPDHDVDNPAKTARKSPDQT